jgi:hypothetical protein
MITFSRHPVPLNAVTDLDNTSFVTQGSGSNMPKIYFESGANNRHEYLGTEIHGAEIPAA